MSKPTLKCILQKKTRLFAFMIFTRLQGIVALEKHMMEVTQLLLVWYNIIVLLDQI